MIRGFVTLATGNIKYYKMALNMLKSFRLHNPGVPFAIVCDRENEVTAEFDDVVILEKANGDYRDKFSLLVNAPYDENIFIEPDCLVYRNLDFFWELLSKESDFSCFGWNKGGVKCWFETEAAFEQVLEVIPVLKENYEAPLFNPGYFFIRKGEKTKKMYEDCLDFAKRIWANETLRNHPHILCRGKLRDDPIFNIAMLVNGFKCNEKPEIGKCIFLPSKYEINHIDIDKSILDVSDKNGKKYESCSLIHFSTRRANEEGLYLWQKVIVDLLYKNRNSVFAKVLNNKIAKVIFCFYRYVKTRIKWVLKIK